MGMGIRNNGVGKKWDPENGAVTATGMTSTEWEGMGAVKVIPARLYVYSYLRDWSCCLTTNRSTALQHHNIIRMCTACVLHYSLS